MSVTLPQHISFLVDPGNPYTIVNPVNEYIYETTGAPVAFSISLPVANTIYAGFRIRISNLRVGGGHNVLASVQGTDTLTGSGTVVPGAQASFMTDGISKWYKI